MRTLQAESLNPLYAQLMKQIRLDIQRGRYPVGTKIPPEHELEVNYGVSRVTVRRALQELTAEGLLERKQGKGTFVSAPKAKFVERSLRGFHENCREMGKVPGIRVLKVREIPGEAGDLKELMLPEGSRVVECQRVCLADGEPVILERNRFSMAYSYLAGGDLNGSLYGLLQEYGIQADKANYDISQKNAEKEEAEALKVEEGTPLLCVRQIVYDQKGRPLHNSLQLIRGDKYRVRI